MHFDHASTPRIMASLTSNNASFVHHVVMDFPVPFPADSERDLTSIFARLYAVHVLTIHGRWDPYGLHAPVDAILARTMTKSFGPTLRKLDLQGDAMDIFDPAELSTFTASLVNLEVLVARFIPFPSIRLALPASLPLLRHLAINGPSFVVLTDITPTHVHYPTHDLLPCILTPNLTHLSLFIPDVELFDFYTSLPRTAPNLVFLALSGSVPLLTRILTDLPPPDIPHVSFLSAYEHKTSVEAAQRAQA
ncbi:hypothetical protein OF83DRAFT_1141192 [Amylostereum chailletii]|nr:hypothetical protein OF83DRAFT_1141192 [Amylostereum chailletii]